MTSKKNISAIILAGGKSSRMGTDKGLVDFRGKKMIEHVLSVVRPIVNETIIISGNVGYEKFGCMVYRDIYKNCGPLGGIHSGLSHSKNAWNIVVSCDMPFVTRTFFDFLYACITDASAVIPVHEKMMEPLCALYHQSSLPEIESLLLKKKLKMQSVVQSLNTIFIDVPTEKFDATMLFRNMNSPGDISISDLYAS